MMQAKYEKINCCNRVKAEVEYEYRQRERGREKERERQTYSGRILI